MKTIGRAIAVLAGVMMLTSMVAALAATAAKRRIVPLDDPEADEVHLAAIFEPLSFRSRAESFRGGTLDAWYGGGIVDLREAELDPAGAHLQVKAIFGGAQVVVPDAWEVVSSVRGIGGIGDGRPDRDRPADAPRLTIDGVVMFGGFGITSEVPEEAVRGVEEAIAKRRRRTASAEG
jgi:hypothetical protein